MRKPLIPAFILLTYCAILVKVMVFKDIPTIRAGGLMLNFAGTNAGHGPNFVPFRTILPYMLGYKGWIIAGINLAGNIRSEEHTSELQSLRHLVCRLLLEKK